MLEMEYSSFGMNTMPTEALAPKVTRASAGMVLAVLERQYVLYDSFRVNFIYLGQAKSKIQFWMWIYLL